jgi:hypothetical protein
MMNAQVAARTREAKMPQTQPTGVGRDHAWAQGRKRTGAKVTPVGALSDPPIYSTDKPPTEPERALIAVGGDYQEPRRHRELMVFCAEFGQALPAECPALRRFAEAIAVAIHKEREGYDPRGFGSRSDCQYLSNGPATSLTNLTCALNRAWRELEEGRKEGVDAPLPLGLES